MASYIERQRVMDALLHEQYGYLCEDAINALPNADVRPVVKATWKRIDFKPYGHDYECSTCGWKNDMATHFCPNCGADMKEE